ncbi:MAG TPA: hypothetical protein VN229_06425, partial [Terriglobales bacterium]|nr:hypothetical protein [Terriglobales bacterium]
PAASDTCRTMGTPAIDVNLTSEPASLDHSRTAHALTEQNAARGGTAGVNHINVVLYYETKLDGMINIQATTRQMTTGADCVWLSSAHVTVQRTNQISVASEVAAGSCADGVLQRQGAEMMARADNHDAAIKQRIKDVLSDPSRGAVADASVENAEKRLEQALSDAVNAQVQEETAAANKEYQAMSKANALQDVAAQCHDTATQHLLQAFAG